MLQAVGNDFGDRAIKVLPMAPLLQPIAPASNSVPGF